MAESVTRITHAKRVNSGIVDVDHPYAIGLANRPVLLLKQLE